MGAPRPPMDYLAKCSQMSLESMELARLNQSANLRKEFLQVLHELIESEVDARLARAMLEWRRSQNECESQCSLSSPPEASIEKASPGEMPELDSCGQLAIAFQPDPTAGRDGDPQDGKLETQRGKRTRCTPSCANVGALEKSSNCASGSSDRRGAAARTSRVIASPNTRNVRSLQGRRLTDSAAAVPKASSAYNHLSSKNSASRRYCGIFLPRQEFANAVPAVVAYGVALRNAS